jgi:microcystin degradation protein MlrC
MHRRSFIASAPAALLAADRAWAQGLIPAFKQLPRIAFGGIGSECSTYSRLRARMEDFTVLRGDAALANDRFSFLKRYDVPFLPTLVATATDGGPVDAATYAALKAELLARLKSQLPLDGVYLAMHGALFVDGMEDAEGDLYVAIRQLVGPDCLMVASYDLHGNISARIVDTLDGLSAYRTAPHVDKTETMLRATDLLTHALRYGLRPGIVWARIPVLLSGEETSTEWEPGHWLWSDLGEYARLPGVLDVSQLVGYVWADEARSAAAVVVTGTAPVTMERIATELAKRYWDARRDFHFESKAGSIDQCVAWALAAPTHPVIISDAGDNPGGGGNGDQTFVLQALIKAGAHEVLLGGMTDRPATEACYAAGVGATLTLSVGGALDPVESTPVKVTGRVKFLAPAAAPMGRAAVLACDNGITITLIAQRQAMHEADAFRALDEEPTAYKIVVLKCGYLAPSMRPLANPHLMAMSPGAIDPDTAHIANRFRGPEFPWNPDLDYVPRPHTSPRVFR